LSVDYVPAQNVPSWISHEERGRGQRFTVRYVKTEAGVQVRHEISESGRMQGVRLEGEETGRMNQQERRQPDQRRHPEERRQPEQKSQPEERRQPEQRSQPEERRPIEGKRLEDTIEVRPGEKVRVLKPDELFRKTSAKPWVYWMEAPQEVRERRRNR
jgi:hypothetical protein